MKSPIARQIRQVFIFILIFVIYSPLASAQDCQKAFQKQIKTLEDRISSYEACANSSFQDKIAACIIRLIEPKTFTIEHNLEVDTDEKLRELHQQLKDLRYVGNLLQL